MKNHSDDYLLLGLDVGGTKCAAIVGTPGGVILDRVQWPTDPHRGPDAVIEELIDHGRTLQLKYRHINAVGVAIGGPLDTRTGVIYEPPNLPGWDGIRLQERLAQALGLPVQVEHDAAACALAEYRWGAGRSATRLVYLTCGTGFGAGIVINGKIYRGANGRPSDFGHIRYRSDGPEAYGKPGSLEGYCAASALGRLAAWRFANRWGPPSSPDSVQVAQWAARGDPDAVEVVRINAQAVGDACAMLGDLLYPDIIILGSLANYLGDSWLKLVVEQFEKEAYTDVAKICRVVPSKLGDKLQDSSALVAATSAKAK